MQIVVMPIWLYSSPELSRHSTVVPLTEELATAVADELKKELAPISLMFVKENGPHGRVKIGGLWSIVCEQSIGGLKSHLVMPLASLSWLHAIVILRPTHAVRTPLASDGVY